MAPRPLPNLPAKHADFLGYINAHPQTPIEDLLKPYNEYDSVLRQVFAQEPSHPALADNHVNVAPIYDTNGSTDLRVRARDLPSESNEVKENYIMPLKDEDRRANGSLAVVPTFKEFQTNFNLFSESSLIDMDWSNVVAAGSAVVTSLLPVPEKHGGSKRQLRQFYHREFAPASDVDLFIYGLTEKQAIEKIKQIERKIKDSILYETTTVRTKNTITIVSQYPTRHVQIVLRIYKSLSEIITGFDVDCACVAYDGRNVYVAPRAAASYITQINQIDLTRRSPSYENRLAKYCHRGFEVFWPQLDRSRIDPTIFERSFRRTVGLARLLILEKLPNPSDRDEYLQKRRLERGRPSLNLYARNMRKLRGNIKDDWENEVADWVDEEEASDYHTFSIPYGEKFHARKIERLLYTKDLLLNAEWNNEDREVNLHRHPAFVGNAEDVIQDCCGYCPKPVTPEEQEVWEEESKTYISGSVSFMKDDPGRQAIGSFNPITETDWTEMAYVGNTAGLCQAIVDHDLEAVKEWLAREGADPNRRDYTGRTPLHLASMTSTPGIVQCLVDCGSRLIWRLADGRTALHLAAERGCAKIVRILLTKSDENEEAEEAKKDRLRSQKSAEKDVTMVDVSDVPAEADDDRMSFVTGSFVDVKKEDGGEDTDFNLPDEEKDDEPDVYDINVLAWDRQTSPLHLAIVNGHTDVVEELVSSFGADVLLPIKLLNDINRSPRGAILPLVLSLQLPPEKATAMIETLLRLGATPAQADLSGKTPLHYIAASPHPELFDALLRHDEPGLRRAINHLAIDGGLYYPNVNSALTAAVKAGNLMQVTKLLEIGAAKSIEFSDFMKAYELKWEGAKRNSSERNQNIFSENVPQPIITAVRTRHPSIALKLLEAGVDPNTLTPDGYIVQTDMHKRRNTAGKSLLDIVVARIRELKAYKGDKVKQDPPVPLEEDDQTYLASFPEGTYQRFTAKEQLKEKREQLERVQKSYEKALKEVLEGKGVEEKKKAIKASLDDFQALEAKLRAKGAKTFSELYPDIKPAEQNHPNRGAARNNEPKPEPFKVKLEFRVSDLTGVKKEGYIKLFEAAWSGDLDTIKSLTLAMWGPKNEEFPLEIANTDGKGYSPFLLAVLRGHLDTAKAILEIARAQYKPREAKGREKFIMANSDDYSDYSDDEATSTDGDIRVEREIIHDEFTIDNIGEISTKVESNVTPLTIFLTQCPAYHFAESEALAEAIRKSHYGSNSLIEFAIWHDNVGLLAFLLDLGQTLTAIYAENDNAFSRTYVPADFEFRLAIRLGRLRCLAELIRKTGVGLPLDQLAEKSGVEMKQKPIYYQGLSIHGKKRADWAAAGRGVSPSQPQDEPPPLLLAGYRCNLESVEWFLSTAPGRHYMEYATAHKQDKRLKRLARTEHGVEGTIMNWLNLRNDLVLHCAIIGHEAGSSEHLIRHLVKNVPNCIDVKSSDGYTPLFLAFSKREAGIAKILIEAGANQAVRDRNGNNLIHVALCNIRNETRPKPANLKTLLGLLDSRLVPSLLTERSSESPGSLTPIARWIHRAHNSDRPWQYNNHDSIKHREADDLVTILHLLLDFAESTGQKHLELFDGTGNSPVHNAVKFQLSRSLEAILQRRPDLLKWENATGCTPLDLTKDSWVVGATRDNPTLPHSEPYSPYFYIRGGNTGLIASPAAAFAPNNDKDPRGQKEIIFDSCLKREREEPGMKRKLVSLFDANEVAKRLAKRAKSRFYGSQLVEGERDEVHMWA